MFGRWRSSRASPLPRWQVPAAQTPTRRSSGPYGPCPMARAKAERDADACAAPSASVHEAQQTLSQHRVAREGSSGSEHMATTSVGRPSVSRVQRQQLAALHATPSPLRAVVITGDDSSL